jgi:uncharacterized protein YcbK (DUF882 family)
MSDWPANFTAQEFACPCGKCDGLPRLIEGKVREVAWALQKGLRDPISLPVQITSGYRCTDHNRAVGGKSQSRHLAGDAVDLAIVGWHGLELAGWIRCQILYGVMPRGGIGTYPDRPLIAHYDTRGTAVRWYA